MSDGAPGTSGGSGAIPSGGALPSDTGGASPWSSGGSGTARTDAGGYFIVADGTPGGSGGRTMDRINFASMGAPLLAYVDWAVAENEKPCGVYYQSLDTAMISVTGAICSRLTAATSHA